MKVLTRNINDVEVDVAKFALSLANASNEEQAEFFNRFYSYLIQTCGSRPKAEMQLFYIKDLLNEEGKE